MSDRLNPTVARRRLAAELKHARQEASLTQENVVARMDWHLAKINRIETAKVGISTNDLRALLRLYGVTAREPAGRLLDLARMGRRQQGWWNEFRDAASPKFLDFVGYEDSAAEIKSIHSLFVPGMLQTREYAEAVIRYSHDANPDLATRIVEFRMRRQRILLGDTRPKMRFLLDEAVLRRMIGGPDVIRRQLRRIIEVSTAPDMDIRVIPFSNGVHSGLFGSFYLLRSIGSEDDDVLFQESATGDVTKDDEETPVKAFQEQFRRALNVALGTTESIDLIDQIERTF